jgi:hypothetical protein
MKEASELHAALLMIHAFHARCFRSISSPRKLGMRRRDGCSALTLSASRMQLSRAFPDLSCCVVQRMHNEIGMFLMMLLDTRCLVSMQ